MSKEAQPETVDITGAAEVVGVCRATLYTLLASGEGPPSLRIRRRRVFRVEALRAWLKELEDLEDSRQ